MLDLSKQLVPHDSVVMLPALDELVQESGFRRSDLAGVVCCVGPGGFTGLRTGVATAEGLAQTGVPTWGFSSFALWAEALALSGQASAAWILLDGQRGEAFLQRWVGGAPRETRRESMTALTRTLASLPWFAPSSFAERLGALPGRLDLGSEAAAAEAALISLVRKSSRGIPESPLVPFYLRETDAEAKFPQASTHLPESHRLGRPR